MSPFSYPKTLHSRARTPADHKNYRSFKDDLRAEFSAQCVYCRIPDTLNSDGKAAFHIDHYRPKSKFPNLSASYGNLYYCCRACNVNKGDYWPTPEDASRYFIPNPCEHRMFSHLRYRGAHVEAQSDAGRWTIEHLDLNCERSVRFRGDSIATKECLSTQLQEFKKTKSSLIAKIDAIQNGRAKLAALESIILDLENAFRRHCGLDPVGPTA